MRAPEIEMKEVKAMEQRVSKEILNEPQVYDPVHPGEILREEFLEPIQMTAYALAKRLDVPVPRINDVVREKRAITADTALRLARFFGNSAQYWLNLQTLYELEIAERKFGNEIEDHVTPFGISA